MSDGTACIVTLFVVPLLLLVMWGGLKAWGRDNQAQQAGDLADFKRRQRIQEAVRQAAIVDKREEQFLESHWTCPRCGTLVGEKQDGCPGCGQRLTLEILKAQA